MTDLKLNLTNQKYCWELGSHPESWGRERLTPGWSPQPGSRRRFAFQHIRGFLGSSPPGTPRSQPERCRRALRWRMESNAAGDLPRMQSKSSSEVRLITPCERSRLNAQRRRGTQTGKTDSNDPESPSTTREAEESDLPTRSGYF